MKITVIKMSEGSAFYQKLPELMEKVIRPMGRFQYTVVLMLCYNNAITGINNVVSTFLTYQPDFHCSNLEINQCFANGTCPEEYIFNTEDKTIVSEWSLICSRSLLAPMVNTFYFVGLTIGAFIGGLVADSFGRKKTLLICLYAQGILGLSLSFAPNLSSFIAMRTFQGFFVQGMQTVQYTLMMKYCKPSIRTLAGMTFELMWSIGLMYLGVVTYAVRDWRNFQLFLAIPTVITLLWSWIIQESMHWHFVNRKEAKAFKLCVKTARYNNNYGAIESEHKYWKENVENAIPSSSNSKEDLNSEEATTVQFLSILRDLFGTKCLRKHLILMTATWFVAPITYWGVLYFMPTITGDRYLNFIISAAIEFCVYFIMCFVLSKFGRRRPLIVYLCVNGGLLISIGMLATFKSEVLLLTIVTLIARGTSASIYYGLSVYGSELFPTINRSCALGLCAFSGRLGSVVSPFVLPLAQQVSPMLPMSILGCLSILVGIAQYFLPETLNIQLPGTIEDAKAIWDC